MAKAKIAITLEMELVEKLDRLVDDGAFPNRSQAIENAVEEQFTRLRKGQLARACARIDRTAERVLAEEGLAVEAPDWPAY